MTWKEITTSDDFKRLPDELRSDIKRTYFQSNIAPGLTGAADEDVALAFRDWMETPDDTGEGLARSMFGAAAQGFLDPLASIPEVAGAYTGIESLEALGGDIRSGIESAFPVNPAQQGFLTDVAGVGGQVGQILATGGAGAATGLKLLGKGATEAAKKQAIKFGATAAQQTAMGSSAIAGGLERAEQLGLEGGDRLLRGAIAGGTELLAEKLGGFATELGPINKFMGQSAEEAWFKPIIRGIGTEAGEEGVAEAAGQATDIAMAPEAAPDMDLKQIGYAMLLGGAGGAMFGGVEAAITPRTKQAFDGTTGFTPSKTPPPGMTAEEAEEQDLLVYGDAGEIIGYKTPQAPVTAETIEAELPVEIAPTVAPLVETVANTPEASATAAALQRIAADDAGATSVEESIADAEDEGILMDVFASERSKAQKREDTEAAALREAALKLLTPQQAPTESITVQEEVVTEAPVSGEIITDQEDQATLEPQQPIETDEQAAEAIEVESVQAVPDAAEQGVSGVVEGLDVSNQAQETTEAEIEQQKATLPVDAEGALVQGGGVRQEETQQVSAAADVPTESPEGQLAQESPATTGTSPTPESLPATGQPTSGDVGVAGERMFVLYKLMDNGKKHYPKLEPMTQQESLTFRSKQTNPAAWGLEEVKVETPESDATPAPQAQPQPDATPATQETQPQAQTLATQPATKEAGDTGVADDSYAEDKRAFLETEEAEWAKQSRSEWNKKGGKDAYQRRVAVWTRKKQLSGAPSYEQWLKQGNNTVHMGSVSDAVMYRSPVSVSAVETYGIEIPEGYVKQGDLYIYQPQAQPATKESTAAQPAAEETGDAGVARLLARSKPRETIAFKKPIRTPLGDVVAYSWSSQLIEDVDKDGEPVFRRISNWEEAATNAETGRDIVHRFTIRKKDGSVSEVSLESTMGALSGDMKKTMKSVISAAKRLPFMRAELAELEAKKAAADADYAKVSKMQPSRDKLTLSEPDAKWMIESGKKKVELDGVFSGYLSSDEITPDGKPKNLGAVWNDALWKWQGAQRAVIMSASESERMDSLRRRIKKAETLLKNQSVEVAPLEASQPEEAGPPARNIETPVVTTAPLASFQTLEQVEAKARKNIESLDGELREKALNNLGEGTPKLPGFLRLQRTLDDLDARAPSMTQKEWDDNIYFNAPVEMMRWGYSENRPLTRQEAEILNDLRDDFLSKREYAPVTGKKIKESDWPVVSAGDFPTVMQYENLTGQYNQGRGVKPEFALWNRKRSEQFSKLRAAPSDTSPSDTGATDTALSKLQSYISTLSPKAQAAWTPERLEAAQSYYATGNESALEPLTVTQRKVVKREGASDTDAAAYEAEQKRQFALRNPPAATDSQFLEDFNAYVNSLSDETLQQERESREKAPGVESPEDALINSIRQSKQKEISAYEKARNEFIRDGLEGSDKDSTGTRKRFHDAAGIYFAKVFPNIAAGSLPITVRYDDTLGAGTRAVTVGDNAVEIIVGDVAPGLFKNKTNPQEFRSAVAATLDEEVIHAVQMLSSVKGNLPLYESIRADADAILSELASNKKLDELAGKATDLYFRGDMMKEALASPEVFPIRVAYETVRMIVQNQRTGKQSEYYDDFLGLSFVPFLEDLRELSIGLLQSKEGKQIAPVIVQRISEINSIIDTLAPSARFSKILRSADGNIRRTGVKSTPARAARNSYIGVIPGVENTWLGTTEDFDAEFPDGYPFDSTRTTVPADTEALVAQDGRAFIFIDRVQVLDGDAERAEQHGTSPGVEAIKRLLRHESFVHRGFMSLPGPLKARFVDFVASGIIPEAELDYLANGSYPQYKNWRNDKTTEMMAAEEWLAQRVERMGRIPQSGPIASIMDWLRDVWRWLTGGETTDLDKLRNTMRAMHKALGALEPGARIVMELPDAALLRRSYIGERSIENLPDERKQFMRDSLDTAKAMAAAGKSSEEIRAVTGWFPGKYDGKMRWELPDDRASLKKSETITAGYPAKQVLSHDSLFEQYPELGSVKVAFVPMPDGQRGRFDDFGSGMIEVNSNLSNEGKLSTLLHEIQHWIQGKEVFASGGNPANSIRNARIEANRRMRVIAEEIKENEYAKTDARIRGDEAALNEAIANEVRLIEEQTKAWEIGQQDPFSLYQSLAGEIEARDVQARQNLTPAQRAATAPYSSENIAPEDAIVMFGDARPSELRRSAQQPISAQVPELTVDDTGVRSQAHPMAFERQDEEGNFSYLPVEYRKMAEKGKVPEAMRGYAKEKVAPYATSQEKLLELLEILRDDRKILDTFGIGAKTGQSGLGYIHAEAALQAERLGNALLTEAFSFERTAVGTSKGQGLVGEKFLVNDPRYQPLFAVSAAGDVARKNQRKTVDAKLGATTAAKVGAEFQDATKEARDTTAEAIESEAQISEKVLELGAAVQGNPKLSERIKKVINDVLRRGILLRAMEKLKGDVRKSIIPDSNIYDGLTLEQMEAELARLDKEIAVDIDFVEKEVAKKPRDKTPKTPVETAKAIINRVQKQAAGETKRAKPQLDRVRLLYKSHLRERMDEADFMFEAKDAGLTTEVAKQLYDAAELEIASILLSKEVRGKSENYDKLTKERLKHLDVDSSALVEYINMLRREGKLGEVAWRDIMQLPATRQQVVKGTLLELVKQNPQLQNLSAEEQQALADALERVWEKERERQFKLQVKRLEIPGATKEDQEKVVSATPRLIKLINQGMLAEDAFYKAVGEQFGIKEMSDADRKRVMELAEKIQDETLGRADKAKYDRELVNLLQKYHKLTTAEILSNVWVAHVLSGVRTQFDMAFGVLNGLLNTIKKAGIVIYQNPNKKGVKAAATGLQQFAAGLVDGINEAVRYVRTEEPGLIDSDIEFVSSYFDGGVSKGGISTARKLKQSDNKLMRALGTWLAILERVNTAWDVINYRATLQGTLAMAAQMNPDIYNEALMPTKADFEAMRERGKAMLGPGATKAQLSAYAMNSVMDGLHLLGRNLDDAFMSQWKAMSEDFRYDAREASYMVDPTGLGGYFYRAIMGPTTKWEREAKEKAQKAKEDLAAGNLSKGAAWSKRIFPPLLYILASQTRNIFGVRFIRFTGNKINELISYIPLVGLSRVYLEEGMMRDGSTTLKGMSVMGNQAIATAIAIPMLIKAMFDLEDDDEERGYIIQGPWDNLTPERKSQLMAAGFKPNTVAFYDKKTGKWNSYNYINWPSAGWFATAGSISDYRRYTPEKWNDKTAAAKVMSGVYAGGSSFLDISSISQMTELFGRSTYSTDPSTKGIEKLTKVASGYAGGFIPRIAKDVDAWFDKTVYKPDDTFGHMAKEMPFYRRNVGSQLRDIFYEPVEVSRTPWSRAMQVSPDDPAYKALAKLNSRGIWLTPANAENRRVKRGGKVREMTETEAAAYMSEVGKRYKDFIVKQGDRLVAMDADRAEELVSKYTARIREVAFKRAIATAGKAAIANPE